MSEKEKQIIETFKEVLPKLSEKERDNLLNFSKGMAFMKDRQKQKENEEQ